MKKFPRIQCSLLFHFRSSSLISLQNCSVVIGSAYSYDHRSNEACQETPLTIQGSGGGTKEPSPTLLLSKLEATLMNHQVCESWSAFTDFKNRYGFPNGRILTKMLTELASSREPFWMGKARNLAMSISKEKPGLLSFNELGKLALTFARAEMPEPASAMIRAILSRQNVPPSDVLRLVFMYMSKSNIGTSLASHVLAEICALNLNATNKGRNFKAFKPSTMLFNLVLDGCIRFNEPIRGQLLVELMAQTGVVADAHSVVAIGYLHEINVQRDEMKSLKSVVDKVPSDLVFHYLPFYDNLLRLHFKFSDISAAAEMLLGINRAQDLIPHESLCQHHDKLFLVPIGPHNMKESSKLLIAPHLVPPGFTLKVNRKQELIYYSNGKLLPSSLALARIILGYRKQGRIADLWRFIIGFQEEFQMQMGINLCSDVINACISLGWLEIAHDILEDAEKAGVLVTLTSYEALLASYQENKMVKEAAALVKQMKKSESIAPNCEAKSSFISSTVIAQAMREEDLGKNTTVYELNSSIYFFCKAKMVGDAADTYRKMQKMKIQPTLQTFAYLAHVYWSLRKLRSIAFLWGDIKRNINSGNLVVSRDLYEMILICFIAGGYFERAMEVINYMRNRNLFIDKQMVRNEFLKLHRDLYKNITETEAKTPAQSNRIVYVSMFRKWAGIN